MTRQIALIILCISTLFPACNKKSKYIFNEGLDHGTTYHVTYESPKGKDLHEGIVETMKKVDISLSIFDPHSTISKVNQNRDTVLDDCFLTVYRKAMEISEVSGGAFDITVAPMVNAWGFGFKNKENITPALIDSLKQLVGYEKIKLVNGKIMKQDPRMMLDCNALAEGYMCDLVGGYLEKQGCKNYMVEIGGEVVAKGKNPKGKYWRIGISRPEESAFSDQKLEAVVQLKEKALSTSGNYRNFYIEDGKKYAHTIDPKTGYPVQHSLLSATVLADSCMKADAFATTFMVLGLEKAIELANSRNDVEVYFIYSDENGHYKSYASDGFKPLLIREYE
ncbi:MAG: FAD:protein FMN transferase [Mangrovibacterium sp.]